MTNSKRKQPTTPNATEANIEDEATKSTIVTDEPTKSNAKLSANKSSSTAQFFKLCFGHDLHNFDNLQTFTKWLHRPVDGAALGVFRMLYGAAMLIDIAEERGGGQLDVRFGEPHHCHFPLFNGIHALDYPLMGCVYLAMWLGAMGIALGYRFRISCLSFVTCYWYIFLLDKPAWNNHSYLFGLVGTLLLFTRANCYCSLDSWLHPELRRAVPYWNYFLIKFQFFVLYMYAGLKKFSFEWLSGYAMTSLSQHWVFAPFRQVLDGELIDLLIIHWFTAFFDLSIAFFMTCEKTRLLVTPFMISFHLMNSRLFVIGMFPWVCLAEVPLFYSFDWPRRLWRPTKPGSSAVEAPIKAPSQTSPGFGAQLRSCLILFYCALQLFLPYSHFITKGYNNWTNGLYGYSWDMMVHSYDTVLTSVKIVDNNNQQVHHLNPYAFTEYDRWTKYADMAVQYAKCIEKNIHEDMDRNPKNSPLTSKNISIYFDIWCAMNGRFQQRTFDPRVDLLKAPWSPFKRTPWSLPLLTELNHMRPKLKTIADEVLAWNNYSDVIFVADFPGLTLSNFIAPALFNCSLTILEGNVRYKSANDDEAYFLTAGKSISLESNATHYVTTIGQKPASYLYTYVNRTMLEQDIVIDDVGQTKDKPLLPLWQEFKQRVSNYQQFLAHLANCLLFLLYDVPIPISIRERD
ncbi:PREDICTED: vitamin K-dependent gamma-carboxylase [Drosophila arizonae]|uniref:Vitamin K-dependent gamma-carboxylase n=1 Tax=Drosophila arizonae TaxID=7263 RepID=A0ABM1P8D3_DROAR|nr:PREDICTED: vitamin K-dependent gamma-carboxylase [Drosophila arizonae]XP_017863469.1 PREDICTED: vitamin K-dependent gamma-carboxylase [Drosophila arizonae]XP_017863470.1 PREDICTED: vitamin K-dependent gamma-carboxylase [Drosophila arizonae]